MYGLNAYFASRNAVELPFRVFFPVLTSSIIYWLVSVRVRAAARSDAVLVCNSVTAASPSADCACFGCRLYLPLDSDLDLGASRSATSATRTSS